MITMKFVLGLVATSLLIALSFGEDCSETSDCVVTQCSGNNAVVCELPNTGAGGKCTCAVPDACSDQTDCYAPAHTELDCPDTQRHCYDSACICSRFDGGGYIPGWGGIGGIGGIGGGGGFP